MRKILLKRDVDIFLKYENVKPQPIIQMTPNKFLQICRIIYDSWKEHYKSNKWYQFDETDSDEKVYCHFKMMGSDETVWYGFEDVMDSYIFDSLIEPGHLGGGYHFEELQFGGPEQKLRSVDMENGSCMMSLSAQLYLSRADSYSEQLVDIILAYNACVKNGYYVELVDKERIVSFVKEIYETIE